MTHSTSTTWHSWKPSTSPESPRAAECPADAAGLDAALTMLEKATGCSDAEAERLLTQWDALSAGYTEDAQGEAERLALL